MDYIADITDHNTNFIIILKCILFLTFAKLINKKPSTCALPEKQG